MKPGRNNHGILQMVINALASAPSTARELSDRLPDLDRSTVNKALTELRHVNAIHVAGKCKGEHPCSTCPIYQLGPEPGTPEAESPFDHSTIADLCEAAMEERRRKAISVRLAAKERNLEAKRQAEEAAWRQAQLALNRIGRDPLVAALFGEAACLTR